MNKTATPEGAVAEFLQAVRVGDDQTAAEMFTPLARERVAELNIQVAPQGSDTARFSVGEVEYVAETGARVTATWTDLDTTGRSVAADYTRTLLNRRSRRNFFPGVISRDRLMAFGDLMAASMGPESGMPPPCRASLATGLLVGEHMPVDPGFYWLDSMAKRLGRVFNGALMPSMAAACLDQMWLQHAGLHLLFLTNVEALDRIWGARGYRYAMIEAGRLGQQAYLTATALGWGACGIGAIYDQEAAELFEKITNRGS